MAIVDIAGNGEVPLFPHRHPRERGDPANQGLVRMHPDFLPMVYIMASARNGTLYVGVTSSLLQRIAQHREGIFDGFTTKYGVKRLVWFEPHSTMEYAIVREKQLKKWNRAWKLDLIEKENGGWRDLAEDFGFGKLR